MTTAKPDIGRYGVFGLAGQDSAVQGEAAAELEELGFGAIWMGHSLIDETAPLVAATSTITVATGIHSIWRLDAAETARRFARIEADSPGRVLLGLGVSHGPMVEGYRKPYTAMTAYLDELDRAGNPVPQRRRALGALGPRMLRLSRSRTAGAVPYLVTAEFTAHAREVLGDQALLAPELGVVLESDPSRAREVARGALSRYTALPNYTANWLRLGFTEADLADGGSDRLVDALFAWGDEERIRDRVEAFHAAGADHVALQAVNEAGPAVPAHQQWRRLAEILIR